MSSALPRRSCSCTKEKTELALQGKGGAEVLDLKAQARMLLVKAQLVPATCSFMYAFACAAKPVSFQNSSVDQALTGKPNLQPSMTAVRWEEKSLTNCHLPPLFCMASSWVSNFAGFPRRRTPATAHKIRHAKGTPMLWLVI